jgi:DNA-binding beta-propeller fold protein YncE
MLQEREWGPDGVFSRERAVVRSPRFARVTRMGRSLLLAALALVAACGASSSRYNDDFSRAPPRGGAGTQAGASTAAGGVDSDGGVPAAGTPTGGHLSTGGRAGAPATGAGGNARGGAAGDRMLTSAGETAAGADERGSAGAGASERGGAGGGVAAGAGLGGSGGAVDPCKPQPFGVITDSSMIPTAVAVFEAGNKLYVADDGNHAIRIFDGTTLAELGSIPVSTPIIHMEIDESANKLYAPAFLPGASESPTIAVTDLVHDRVLHVLDSGGYSQLVKDEELDRMYVSYNGGVSAINVATDTVLSIDGITGGNSLTSMAVNPTTHELFVANWSQNDDVLYIVDPDTLEVSTEPDLQGLGVTVDWLDNKVYVPYCGATLGAIFCVHDRQTHETSILNVDNDSTRAIFSPLTGSVYSSSEVDRTSTVIKGADDSWQSVSLEPGGNGALAVRYSTGNVYYVMPSTTKVVDSYNQVVADVPAHDYVARGGEFDQDIAINQETGLVYVINDQMLGAVVVIQDPNSCGP